MGIVVLLMGKNMLGINNREYEIIESRHKTNICKQGIVFFYNVNYFVMNTSDSLNKINSLLLNIFQICLLGLVFIFKSIINAFIFF